MKTKVKMREKFKKINDEYFGVITIKAKKVGDNEISLIANVMGVNYPIYKTLKGYHYFVVEYLKLYNRNHALHEIQWNHCDEHQLEWVGTTEKGEYKIELIRLLNRKEGNKRRKAIIKNPEQYGLHF